MIPLVVPPLSKRVFGRAKKNVHQIKGIESFNRREEHVACSTLLKTSVPSHGRLARVRDGIYRHDFPNAVCAFENVDASVDLRNLLKMFQVDAEQAAKDNGVHVTVRADKNCLAGIFCHCIFQRRPRTILHVTEIFSCSRKSQAGEFHSKVQLLLETFPPVRRE